MDSLTQIVLGAACGELTLGKKVGNKALLWGAIAGTIPDLDTFSSIWLNDIDSNYYHRGVTHSILFAVIMSPVMGSIVHSIHKKSDTTFKNWSWLFFWGFFTHSLLDACTTWGTKLFWPFSNWAVSLKTIFVIDPLYTLPFLLSLIILMFFKRNHPKRRFWAISGISVSTSYLLLAFILKNVALNQFSQALTEQNITATRIENRPAPLNTLLWAANAETDHHYYLGYYSFFDSQPIRFNRIEKNHHLLSPLAQHKEVQRFFEMTQKWYSVEKVNSTTYILNDLRFGRIENFETFDGQFVFSYLLKVQGEEISISQQPNTFKDGNKMLKAIYTRILGN